MKMSISIILILLSVVSALDLHQLRQLAVNHRQVEQFEALQSAMSVKTAANNNDIVNDYSFNIAGEVELRRSARRYCAYRIGGKCIPPCSKYRGKAKRPCKFHEKRAHIMYYLRRR